MAEKTILWDFDGTLAYREGLWSGCLAAVLQEHEPRAGITRDDVRPLLKDGFPWHTPDRAHPELSTPEAWWEVVEALLIQACQHLGFDDVKARRYAHETHERYIDAAGFQLFDDTLPVLRSLQEKGWRHIILSNHVPELRDIVEGLHLAELIEDALSSAVTGFEKPHPKAFELGREAAGHPDELWMVGDNPSADVRGAEALGIPAILVRTSDSTVRRRSDDLFGIEPFLLAGSDVVIRDARPDEAENLFALQKRSAVAGFAHIFDPAEHPFPDAAERARWASYVDSVEVDVLVAEVNNLLAGVAVVDGNTLERLFVTPERWGAGVGSLLHDASIELVRRQGHTQCELWVLNENRQARDFYEKRGWQQDGRTRQAQFPPFPPAVGYTLLLGGSSDA